MGSKKPASWLAMTALVVAVVPSVLLNTGVSRAAAATCGSLNRQTGPVGGGELANVSFVSAGQSWAVGNVSSVGHPNRTLVERFDGSSWSVVSSPDQGSGNNALNAFP
jgi:hypothetical protein